MSTLQKSKFIWDTNKYLKNKLGYKLSGSNSAWYRQKMPKGFKIAGRLTSAVSVGMIGVDIYQSNKIKASHILNSAITGASFIPGYGWIIGGVYLGADLISTGVTGKSIGDHLDRAIEEHYNLDDGALIDFSN